MTNKDKAKTLRAIKKALEEWGEHDDPKSDAAAKAGRKAIRLCVDNLRLIKEARDEDGCHYTFLPLIDWLVNLKNNEQELQTSMFCGWHRDFTKSFYGAAITFPDQFGKWVKKFEKEMAVDSGKDMPPKGQWSKAMSKAKMMAALGLDSYKTFNAFAKRHGIEEAGNRQTFIIRLDKMDEKTRSKLEKA
jgi:hypothetical protein